MVRKVKKANDNLEFALAVREEMIKKHVKRDVGFHGCTCAGVVTDKGKKYHDKGLACHAFLQRTFKVGGEQGTRTHIITLNQRASHTDWEHSREDLLVWYDFLCNHSPMSGDCVTTDPAEALDKGMIVKTDTVGFNLTQCLMIATRTPWEYGNPAVKIFAGLVRKKIPMRLAFLIATCAQNRGEDASLDRTGWGHFPLDHENMGLEEWKNFINGTPAFESEPYAVNNSYYGVHKAWGICENGNNMLGKIQDIMNLEEKKKGFGKKVPCFNVDDIDDFVERFDLEMMVHLGLSDVM